MARTGNLAEIEQRLAAQRREDEREARERKQRERELNRILQLDHAEAEQEAAAEQTAALTEQLKLLDDVLTSALTVPPMSFDQLMVAPPTLAFDPGSLAVAGRGPDWIDFAPDRPRGLSRLLGGGVRYKRQLTQARARFEAATAEHRAQESQRQRDLAVAREKYHRKLSEQRARAAARNATITKRRVAYGARDAEAVQWFAGCVLKASRYPDDFPREYQVAYDPGRQQIEIDAELPPREVIPAVRAYRYAKQRDVIEPLPRPQQEIGQRHERLAAAIALRTLHEIFAATTPEVVRAVSFTGYVATTDRATGQPVRAQMVSVSADRLTFDGLVLASVDPPTCLASLSQESKA